MMMMMTSLKWLLHSACHVLGYPADCDHEDGKSPSIKAAVCGGGAVVGDFQMPVHYPRYTKAEYEEMEEWRLDLLLHQYGLISYKGTLDEKRAFAIGAFLWPHHTSIN